MIVYHSLPTLHPTNLLDWCLLCQDINVVLLCMASLGITHHHFLALGGFVGPCWYPSLDGLAAWLVSREIAQAIWESGLFRLN
jgi:hypothetical protein